MDDKDSKAFSPATIALCVLALGLAAVFWKTNRPSIARAVVSLSVAESKALLSIKALVPDAYEQELRRLAIGGTVRLCAGRTAKPGERPDLVVNGTGFRCSYGVKPFKDVGLAQMTAVLNVPSRASIVPVTLLLLFFAFNVYKTDIRKRFRRTFTLESYIKHMARFHPHLVPIANIRLDKEPPRGGHWDVKDTYISFATKHGLLRDTFGKSYDETSGFAAPYYDQAKCHAVLVAQLGNRWNGDPATLAPHQLALLGIFSALVSQDRGAAIKAVDALNRSFRHHRKDSLLDRAGRTISRFVLKVLPDDGNAFELIRTKLRDLRDRPESRFSVDVEDAAALVPRYFTHPLVQSTSRRHAFVNTFLPALLELAINERSGEFCQSKILWLKPIDRTLFYCLHQVGLQAANLESAGPYEHGAIEKNSGYQIGSPEVFRSVAALADKLVAENWLSQNYEAWNAEKTAMNNTGTWNSESALAPQRIVASS